MPFGVNLSSCIRRAAIKRRAALSKPIVAGARPNV